MHEQKYSERKAYEEFQRSALFGMQDILDLGYGKQGRRDQSDTGKVGRGFYPKQNG